VGWRLVLEGEGARLYDLEAQISDAEERWPPPASQRGRCCLFSIPRTRRCSSSPLGLLPVGPGYLV
jgi:hypothetical protein